MEGPRIISHEDSDFKLEIALEESSLSFYLSTSTQGRQHHYKGEFSIHQIPEPLTRHADTLEEIFEEVLQDRNNFRVEEGAVFVNALYFKKNRKEEVALLLEKVLPKEEKEEKEEVNVVKEVELLKGRVEFLEQKLNQLLPSENMG